MYRLGARPEDYNSSNVGTRVDGMRLSVAARLVTSALMVFGVACRTAVDLTPAHAGMNAPVGEAVGLARVGDEPLEFPPFGRVIARPELYHAKRISLIGFMNLEFEGNALYHSESEYRHGQSSDALWLAVDGLKVKPPFARGWVIVEGTFNGEHRGHFGLFSGTLERITRMEAWKIRR